MDKNVIDLPIGIDDLKDLLDVVSLLSNTEELLKDFKSEVDSFLVKEDFFPKGVFRDSYYRAFDELIVSLIKKEVIKHFPQINPQDVMIICDADFLKMVAPELFDINNYKPKDEVN